jgi:hypothetical protein
VADERPTKVGDVLILRTRRSFSIYAVGAISAAGQDDFSRPGDVVHVGTQAAAVTAAKRLRARDGRIYLRDIDTDHWSEMA